MNTEKHSIKEISLRTEKIGAVHVMANKDKLGKKLEMWYDDPFICLSWQSHDGTLHTHFYHPSQILKVVKEENTKGEQK